jgi:preprotein translocase subunit YajC
VVLKVADNTQLKFQRLAISAVLPKGTIKEVG